MQQALVVGPVTFFATNLTRTCTVLICGAVLISPRGRTPNCCCIVLRGAGGYVKVPLINISDANMKSNDWL